MRSEVLKQSVLLTFFSFFSRGLSFISSIFVARILLPAELGLLDVAVTIFTSFFVAFTVNLPFSMARFLSTEKDKKKVFNAGIYAVIILTSISFLILFLLYPIVSSYFSFDIIKLYMLVLFAGCLYVFNLVLQNIAQGFEKFNLYNLTLFLQAFVFFSLVALDYFIGLPFGLKHNLVTGAVLFYAISYLIPICVSLFLFKSYFSRFNYKDVLWIVKTCLISYSAPMIISVIVTILQKFVFYQVSPSDLGQNRVIDILSLLIIVPMTSLGTVLFPKITKVNSAKPDIKAYQNLIRRALALLSLSIFVMSFFGYYIVRTFFGDNYILAAELFSIGVLGLFFNIFSGFMIMLMLSVNSLKKHWLIVSVVSPILSFILTFVLIPSFGLRGYLVLNLIVNLFSVIYCIVLLSVKTKMNMKKLVLMFLISSIVIPFGGQLYTLGLFVSFVIFLFVFLVLFLIANLLKVINIDDYNLLFSMLIKIKSSLILLFNKKVV
jgi:O-antigen/teichoic acid export membrane protein